MDEPERTNPKYMHTFMDFMRRIFAWHHWIPISIDLRRSPFDFRPLTATSAPTLIQRGVQNRSRILMSAETNVENSSATQKALQRPAERTARRPHDIVSVTWDYDFLKGCLLAATLLALTTGVILWAVWSALSSLIGLLF